MDLGLAKIQQNQSLVKINEWFLTNTLIWSRTRNKKSRRTNISQNFLSYSEAVTLSSSPRTSRTSPLIACKRNTKANRWTSWARDRTRWENAQLNRLEQRFEEVIHRAGVFQNGKLFKRALGHLFYSRVVNDFIWSSSSENNYIFMAGLRQSKTTNNLIAELSKIKEEKQAIVDKLNQ